MHNQLDVDILKGHTIVSFEKEEYNLTLHLVGGGQYRVELTDDGGGGNDSHAFFEKVELGPILGKELTEAFHEGKTSEGVRLVLRAGKDEGQVEVVHQHNGYYGFSYEVIVDKPEPVAPPPVPIRPVTLDF